MPRLLPPLLSLLVCVPALAQQREAGIAAGRAWLEGAQSPSGAFEELLVSQTAEAVLAVEAWGGEADLGRARLAGLSPARVDLSQAARALLAGGPEDLRRLLLACEGAFPDVETAALAAVALADAELIDALQPGPDGLYGDLRGTAAVLRAARALDRPQLSAELNARLRDWMSPTGGWGGPGLTAAVAVALAPDGLGAATLRGLRRSLGEPRHRGSAALALALAGQPSEAIGLLSHGQVRALRDTAAAFEVLGPGEANALARGWLAQAEPVGVDQAEQARGAADGLALEAMQRADGSLFADLRATARALPLLAPAAASAAGEWLTQRSLPGGGWALLEGDEAEVYATGLVLVAAATSEHPGLGLAAAGGRAWLADQQGPDGCFGPDELSCAVVAEALAVGGEDPSAVAAALLARQGPSGAWDGGDPYSTARALAALVALGPNLWAEALTLAPESPPRGGAATATLRVRNAGWASAAAFTVRLTGRASADPPLAAEAHRDFKGPMSMLNLT